MNLKTVAYHEAGHAVISIFLRLRVRYATLKPDEDSKGHVRYGYRPIDPNACDIFSRNAIWLRSAIVSYAGPIAQRRYSPSSVRSFQGSGDFSQIADAGLAMAQGGTKEANALFRWLRLHTEGLVDVAWPQIKSVAEELLRKGRLSEKEICDAMRAAPLK
jgi:hypothetical protein